MKSDLSTHILCSYIFCILNLENETFHKQDHSCHLILSKKHKTMAINHNQYMKNDVCQKSIEICN